MGTTALLERIGFGCQESAVAPGGRRVFRLEFVRRAARLRGQRARQCPRADTSSSLATSATGSVAVCSFDPTRRGGRLHKVQAAKSLLNESGQTIRRASDSNRSFSMEQKPPDTTLIRLLWSKWSKAGVTGPKFRQLPHLRSPQRISATCLAHCFLTKNTNPLMNASWITS